MADKSYWEKRQLQRYLSGEQKVVDYYKDLKKSFEQAKREIHKVVNDFVMRYGVENNSPSYTTAMRTLNKVEIGDLQAFIDKAKENMGKYDLELSNMSIRARITRYQALEKQIDVILQQLYGIEYQYKGEEVLKDIYSDSYYQTWFGIDQYKGFHQEFAQVSAKTVEELIKYPFNGADFSTRLWKQKAYTLQSLSENITTMLIQGRNPRVLAPAFAKKFASSEFEAYRLLHTEMSFMAEQGSQRAYKEDDVEKYQWLATLDMLTCEECQGMDNKVFDTGKGIVGVSMTPKHPLCRCTTIPYYEEDEEETRVARDAKGKTYKLPANVSYPEWLKMYIHGQEG
jgi:SPP1 gp7 family putative phage head morphogenesis protein